MKLIVFLTLVFQPLYANEVLFEKDHISVVKTGNYVRLKFFNTTQSVYTDGDENFTGYSHFFHLNFMIQPQIESILEIGFATGMTYRSIRAMFPKINYTGIEVDQDVIDIAKKYMKLKEHPQLKLINDDGRSFLQKTTAKYDAIFIDAYMPYGRGAYIPYELATEDFFNLALSKMNKNAVLSMNLVDSRAGAHESLVNWVGLTASKVFKKVYVFKNHKNSRQAILFATNDLRTSIETFRIKAISHPHKVAKLHPHVLSLAAKIYEFKPQGFNLRILRDKDIPESKIIDGLK